MGSTLYNVLAVAVHLSFWASRNVHGMYSSQWAARIHGGREKAEEIASKHGFQVHAEIFSDVYHLEHRHVAKRSAEPHHHFHKRLISEPTVSWAEQQTVKRRSKRGFVKMLPRAAAANSRSKHAASRSRVPLNDPRWPQMWYLNRGNGLDMNVQGAWEEGITGKGVVITILDDGLEKDHPDLVENYDPLASYDVNSHDDDPMPRYDQVDSNRHGTRCAGEVAATANNSLCSVGIAFHASVGGVRMLDGDVTDAVEARSLSLNPGHIDIYSASWGPDDDGKTVDGPGELATRAFVEGVTRGREGKGSIFVWASGNGGRDHDNCNCDGYTNSVWTLSTSSATETGQVPWYSEACSSTLATTYSSGSSFEHQVITTDLHHDCTSNHTGTSASAPLAAAICALALEANPSLTWRDLQHIVVATARPANLQAPDWATNGVGRNVSHSFGYGLMDATGMVRLSRKWRTVPEQFKCEARPSDPDEMERQIPAKSSIRLKLEVSECPQVNYLEHVQARVTLSAHRRGDLKIILISPSGTRATLLAPRPHDSSKAGFNGWPFMSVHSWGEQPFGTWYLEIHNEGRYFAQTTAWSMVLYGTSTPPSTLDNKPIITPPLTRNSTQDKQSADPLPDLVSNHIGSGSPRLSSRAGLTALDNRESASSLAASDSSTCRLSAPVCLECGPGYFLHDGKCTVRCPVGTYADPLQNTCESCHYSCKRCTGSNNDQCSVCWPDGALFKSLCVPSILMEDLNTTHWYYLLIHLFYLNMSLLLLVTLWLCYTYRGSIKSYLSCIAKRREPALTRLRYSKQLNDLDLSDSEDSS